MNLKISTLGLIFILLACHYKGIEASKKSDSIHSETSSHSETNSAPKQSKEVQSDSSHIFLKYLTQCGLISSSSLTEKNILRFKTVRSNNSNISLITLEGTKEFTHWNGDPIYNILIVHNTNEVRMIKSVSSVNEDDFRLLKILDSIFVFEYYSSPVGYTKLYFIDKKLDLYESEKISEGESVILESIYPALSSIKIKTLDNRFFLRNISKITWDKCRQ